ncbi:MAG: T9SS type A sorting domain-containing protein [Bacteroidales bacterium]|nr:T9SS type A sorting domain-containing protein [Bacteroidales bacterium]
MKKFLLFFGIITLLLFVKSNYGQTTTVDVSIIQNGEVVTDTLENGQLVTYSLSSDDAEQENDEMDSLHDDDLDAGWEGDPEDLNILSTGLRFQGVPVPKGATIESAYLEVTSHEVKNAEDVAKITMVGQKDPNPVTFTMDALITGRPQTDASVLWEVAEEWGLWTPHQSVDISSIIQEIIDLNGWNYGNSLVLILKGENQGTSDYENAREFESFENISDPEDGGDGQNHPERVPKLVIEYSVESTFLEVPIIANGEIVTDTLENGQLVTYQLSSDDAEQENDEMDTLHDDDLDAGWEGDPEDLNILSTGLRFQSIEIPHGAQIDSAYILLCSHESKNAEDVAKITIVGETYDNAPTFTMDQLITDRPKTDASVMWEVAEEWGLWTYHRTPDISDIIQEIIDRENWVSGNSLGIHMLGENQGTSDYENAREFESFENIADPEDGGDGQNHPERVPRLLVYFSGSQSVTDIFAEHKTLDIFPNPVTNGLLNIRLESDAICSLTLTDAKGNVVLEKTTENTILVNLDLRDLPKGIYFIRAIQDENSYSQKIIVR